MTMTEADSESLSHITSGRKRFEAARERQKALMRAGKRLRKDGEVFPSCETLHER